jgi:hypothetical protein
MNNDIPDYRDPRWLKKQNQELAPVNWELAELLWLAGRKLTRGEVLADGSTRAARLADDGSTVEVVIRRPTPNSKSPSKADRDCLENAREW